MYLSSFYNFGQMFNVADYFALEHFRQKWGNFWQLLKAINCQSRYGHIC